jgi:transcriptional regulator with XRE-family HTH domain
MTSKERIRAVLKREKVSQERYAQEVGVAQASVSSYLSTPGEVDSIRYLEAAEKLTGYSFEWLRTGHGDEKRTELTTVNEVGKKYLTSWEMSRDFNKHLSGKTIRPVTVTVNPSGHELITLVGVRAQAGYLRGYGDPHYIEQLPAFSLPILKNGSYRMFEVDGDSMLQQGGGGLHDGDIVIAQYVEDFFTLKDRRVYVVISTEGVCVKRCINRLKDKDNPLLVCQSDNKNGQHPDIIVRPHEIIEVWELKAFISKQLGFATDLWDVLSKVEAQVALMNEKIKRIEEERAGGGF